MPFGTRRRTRPAFRFIDPILPIRLNQQKKIEEISKQGLENTSQREEERPSAKAPIEPTIQKEEPKPKPSQPKSNPKPEPKSLPKPQAKVLQIITDKVKDNVKKIEKKIEGLTTKGMREKLSKAIKLKEQQLKKLRTLLLKCPTCN